MGRIKYTFSFCIWYQCSLVHAFPRRRAEGARKNMALVDMDAVQALELFVLLLASRYLVHLCAANGLVKGSVG